MVGGAVEHYIVDAPNFIPAQAELINFRYTIYIINTDRLKKWNRSLTSRNDFFPKKKA